MYGRWWFWCLSLSRVCACVCVCADVASAYMHPTLPPPSLLSLLHYLKPHQAKGRTGFVPLSSHGRGRSFWATGSPFIRISTPTPRSSGIIIMADDRDLPTAAINRIVKESVRLGGCACVSGRGSSFALSIRCPSRIALMWIGVFASISP